MKKFIYSFLFIVYSVNFWGQQNILGGTNIGIEEVPWQVSIIDNSLNNHFCGGSIIDKEWILTAAHCLENVNPSEIKILVGTNNKKGVGGVYINCDRIIIHPNYDGNTLNNDIALIHLSKSLTFTKNINFIPPNKYSELNSIGNKILLTGWGITNNPTDILQQITIPIISREDAIKIDNRYTLLNENMISLFKKNKGAAPGDSGGPAVIEGCGKKFLIGISSWGFHPKDKKPTVYTKVSKYYNWIYSYVPKPYQKRPTINADFTNEWNFCQKIRFYLDNLPDGSSVDWKFNGYNSKVISEKTDEIVIDFGTEHNARVEAHITMPCGEKKTLAHICFNNAYIRNEFVYLKVIENQGRKIVAKLGLTDGTARFLKDKEANYFTITNTHDCIAEKSATENRVYISFTGYNPSITFSIKSLDNCETQTATFFIKPTTDSFPYLIPSQESGKTIDNISTDIENCSNTTALAGQVYTYKRAGARKIYVDFSLTPLTNPKTNDTTRWDWSKQQPSIAHLYPNAYFECIPINNTIPYMHPLKIPATSGEIFYNSPRYVGIGDWDNVRIRFVNGCNASNWQLLQFDEYYSTNGYYVDRDKGYESPHLLRISPNPARDKVHLWIESNDDLPNSTPSFSSRNAFRSVGMPYQIKIYNLQGILVRSEEGSGDVAEISVEGLPSGIYVIHFSQKDKTYTSKIIVE